MVTHPNGPKLNGFMIIDCLTSLNCLNAVVRDDDGGSSSVIVDFDTQDGIEVLKLCPDINLMMNNGGLTNQSITFFLDYFFTVFNIPIFNSSNPLSFFADIE